MLINFLFINANLKYFPMLYKIEKNQFDDQRKTNKSYNRYTLLYKYNIFLEIFIFFLHLKILLIYFFKLIFFNLFL